VWLFHPLDHRGDALADTDAHGDQGVAGTGSAERMVDGNDTTIGTGSIVLADIPPRVLAAGTPCRVVRPV